MRLLISEDMDIHHFHCSECEKPFYYLVQLQFEKEFVSICGECLEKAILLLNGKGNE